MFEELKSLLENDKNRNDQITGRLIDNLRKIEHFKDIESQLGSEYLISLIPVIKPFVLRKDFTLINQSDHYVLIEGDLRVQDVKLGGNRVFSQGKLINLKDNSHLKFVAFSDCNMVRIIKGLGVHAMQQKKLLELEREKKRKLAEYQKLIVLPNHQSKVDFMCQNTFFRTLGSYDMFELAIGSQLKEYNQSVSTHFSKEKVQRIGYIVSGKIKLIFQSNKNGRRDNAITWFLNEKDWIGLEEFLWNEPFKSSGQVYSIGAIILWIPVDLFSSKYNNKVNYEAINQLVSLIKTKKILFARSFNTRMRKQQEIEDLKNTRRELSLELQEKMKTLQGNKYKTKTHFSISRNQIEKKATLPMPETIVHKIKNLQEDSIVLPRIKEKIIFFPEQYANIPISTIHKKEMQRLQMVMGTYRETSSQPSIDHNPETLYQTIYDKISYRFPRKIMKNPPKSPLKEESSVIHHNQSIYNNFKVSSNRSGYLGKTNTLYIDSI